MTIKYDRLMNVKPGSMPAVLEMGPKFPELAKKILGDDFVGDVRFYARTLGPLNQVMWSWEVESMDEEMARGAKLQASEEWNEMVSELMPHIESSSLVMHSGWRLAKQISQLLASVMSNSAGEVTKSAPALSLMICQYGAIFLG